MSGDVDALARKLGPVIVGVGPALGVADGALAERFNVDPSDQRIFDESELTFSLQP